MPETKIPNARVSVSNARQVGPEQSRTLRFIGTDETRDRYNTFFTRDGWDFNEFRKNPVFLFHHNHDGSTPTLPIGRVVNIEKTDASGTPGWAFDVEFAKRELYPFADVVYQMYREGFMNAVSVGFIVKQRRAVTDPDEQKRLGFEPGFAEIYERTELTELSAVPVPGNQNALIQRMRSFVPEHLRDAVKAEAGQELDGAWLADRLALLHEALELDQKANEASARAATAGERAIETMLTNAMDAERADAPTPAEVSAALDPVDSSVLDRNPAPSFEAQTLETFREILTELRALRQAMERPPVLPAPPAAAPVAPVPALESEHIGDGVVTNGRDYVELVLGENLATLQRLAVGTKVR